MSMLSRVTSGKIVRPYSFIIYGVDGIGKTSFGSTAPDPIFFGTEKGTDHLDVKRWPEPQNWKDVQQTIDELTRLPHPYKTLVIDTLDWLEPLLWRDIAQRNGVNEVGDVPYGGGYNQALAEWQRFYRSLEKMRDARKMHLIVLGHADIDNFTDPKNEQNTYQRYVLKLHKKSAAFWREAVDSVFFADSLVHKKEDKKAKKLTFIDDDRRVLHTERKAGWDAKNRYGLPPVVTLKDWPTLMADIERQQTASPDALRAQVHAAIDELVDTEIAEKARRSLDEAGNDVRIIKSIAKRVAELKGAEA